MRLERGRALGIGAVAAAVVALGAAGAWAALGAPGPAAHPPSGGVLQVSYEVRRAPAYMPPPVTEATRLEVLGAPTPTRVEDGVLSAQAADSLRSLATEDAARSAAALAAVRESDARIDREIADALRDTREIEASPTAEAEVAPTPS